MSKVAIVTGANQGLGFALAKGLANRLSADDIVYLTARYAERGRAALRSLGDTRAQVAFAQLDVTDDNSIAAFITHLKAKNGGVDIVASNAAARITKDRPKSEQVRALIATKRATGPVRPRSTLVVTPSHAIRAEKEGS
ncbi:SDR family NAD(P)-dependent oxidoreductase [Ruegeria arenilitoris]|uniref:SDR family NAD(P)-dependent oxidoreductase n=1 Tax=Ruegeria arenilitoris TaxID=1173585 RepID=UPI00147F30D2|nr:SDR family NAD(P)-dependent oxidoreductase [Ruegeria arenilitoris]